MLNNCFEELAQVLASTCRRGFMSVVAGHVSACRIMGSRPRSWGWITCQVGTYPRAPQRGHTRWTPWHPLEPIRVGGTHPGSTMKNTSNENLNGPISDPTTCTRVTSKGHVSYYNTLLIYQCDTKYISSCRRLSSVGNRQAFYEAISNWSLRSILGETPPAFWPIGWNRAPLAPPADWDRPPRI